MPLLLLGLIAVGATALLIYYSLNSGGRTPRSGESQRPIIREKHYEKSDDGKVVYLYNKEKKTAEDRAETDAGRADDTRDNVERAGKMTGDDGNDEGKDTKKSDDKD